MTTPIQGSDLTSFVNTLERSTQRPAETGATERGGVDFAGRVEQMLDQVNTSQVNAQQAAEQYANGQRNDMHGTMIAMEQADITLRLVSNIRGRLVEAYREVMRMGA